MAKILKCTKKPPKCPSYKNGACSAYKECEYQTGFSNGDRIRAMSDEELASITVKRKNMFLQTKGYSEIMYVCSDGSVTDDYATAITHEAHWLKEKAEHG